MYLADYRLLLRICLKKEWKFSTLIMLLIIFGLGQLSDVSVMSKSDRLSSTVMIRYGVAYSTTGLTQTVSSQV
jgi:hypothetical protein